MSLDQFSREGRVIEVRVPWLDMTLWFVPTLDYIDRLLTRGVHRGRIWTAGELTDLMKVGLGCREAARTLGRIKVDFGAELVSISVPAETDVSGMAARSGKV